ncbi:alpha/beta hydrolase [Undibacterium flavidum]|uniref:Alpha/beta hydrolase n=1 Tax=Undibacterium flavidum TaxID=2762297 RepID=A0ABR6YG96_9BURK|nr:alpha/beta hydrolase [Undibacterium flavidum]MBC3875537.1 alpha/beta hydrolase [Undibacterium flavidum]
MKRLFRLFSFSILLLITLAFSACQITTTHQEILTEVLHDSSRARDIPVSVFTPVGTTLCHNARCPVAFISPGYGSTANQYRFLSNKLNQLGYLVVEIDNQLPTDVPIPKTGDLQQVRTPYWESGVLNIRYAIQTLSARYPQYDWSQVTLLGHSNGGDISSRLANQSPAIVNTLITLDHRRVALPRTGPTRVLTFRADEFLPDPGVVPDQSSEFVCVQKMKNTKHGDLDNNGPARIKEKLLIDLQQFLVGKSCPAAE